jgi:AsmA protein
MDDTPLTAYAASVMKRRIVALGVAAVLCGIAAVLLPSLFSTESLNRDIELQIHRTTGLSARITGPVHLSFLPQPVVEIANIGLADPSGALRISAQSLTGYLRFMPLLAGRFEIARASLAHPSLVIDLDGRPMTSDSAIGRAAESKPDSGTHENDYTRLGSVDLVGGSARLVSQTAHIDRFIEDVSISIDWPNLGAAAAVTGRFKFRDEQVKLSAWFAKPIELLRGAESDVSLKVDSAVASLVTSGTFDAGSHLQYRGSMETKVASLRRLAELTGHSFPQHGRFADLDLSCDATFGTYTAALSNLRLRLDGNEFEGTLAIQNGDAKPLVSGTLATNYLDLAPFLVGLPDPLLDGQRWNPAPIDTADLGFADLDLRVSATRLRLAQMEVRDAALSLITRTGGMDLTLAEATANQGKVKGRVSLAVQDGGGLALRATASVKDLRLRPLPINVDGQHELSGSLGGTLALGSEGSSISDLMSNVAGKIQLSLDSGALTRFDLESLLTFGTSSRQATADANAPLDGAKVGLKIAAGRAEIETGRVHTKGINLVFGGNANMAERSFDLWALTQPLPGSEVADGEQQKMTRISLTGPWDVPRLSLDRVNLSAQPTEPVSHDDGKSSAGVSYTPGEE